MSDTTYAYHLTLLLNLLSALFLAGAAWHRRLALLPLLRRAGRDRFLRLSRPADVINAALFTPPMLFDAVLACALLLMAGSAPSWELPALGVLLGASAVALQFTLVRKTWMLLRAAFDPRAYRALLHASWTQAALWSFRAIVMLLLLSDAL